MCLKPYKFPKEKKWMLKMLVKFLKQERLMYTININPYKCEFITERGFISSLIDFYIGSVIGSYKLTKKHCIYSQFWRFYLLEHFQEIKFPPNFNLDWGKNEIKQTIYYNGTYDNEKLRRLFKKHKIKTVI